MKIREEVKLKYPINMQSGDAIECTYEGRPLVRSTIDRTMKITDVIIFDLEQSDDIEAKDGIGGVFVEREE